MRSRRHNRSKEAPELDITAFLNLMVVLVPFLLVSAVFSRVTVLELNMPSGAGGGAPDDPTVVVEVVVRKQALEISDGEKVIARFASLSAPRNASNAADGEPTKVTSSSVDSAVTDSESADEDEVEELLSTEQVYDLAKLQEFLLRIKDSYPEKTDSMLLMEEDIPYEHLVGVMDAMRGAEVVRESSEILALNAGPQVEPKMDPKIEPKIERVVLFPDISIGDAP